MRVGPVIKTQIGIGQHGLGKQIGPILFWQKPLNELFANQFGYCACIAFGQADNRIDIHNTAKWKRNYTAQGKAEDSRVMPLEAIEMRMKPVMDQHIPGTHTETPITATFFEATRENDVHIGIGMAVTRHVGACTPCFTTGSDFRVHLALDLRRHD